MVHNNQRKVTFDLDGGLLTWDFFDDNGIDQLRADPVGTAFGLLHREAQNIAAGRSSGGYDGRTLMPSSVDGIFIEIEHESINNLISVDGPEIRAHADSGSTSAGAYGELNADQIALTRATFVRVFAPETIVIPRMPAPIEIDRTESFGYVARGEEHPQTLRTPSRPVIDWAPPVETDDYDGPINVGPVS
jgi:hypothetical protein